MFTARSDIKYLATKELLPCHYQIGVVCFMYLGNSTQYLYHLFCWLRLL